MAGTVSGLCPVAGLFVSTVELLLLPACKVCAFHAETHHVKAHSNVHELTTMTKDGKQYSFLPLYATDALFLVQSREFCSHISIHFFSIGVSFFEI